jgi:hypothetical protein
MKITQRQLRQIIKEEIAQKLNESRAPGGRSYQPMYRTDAGGFPLPGFGGGEPPTYPRSGLPVGHQRPGPSWNMSGTGYSDKYGADYFDREALRLLQSQETISSSVYAQSPGVPADARYMLRLDDTVGYVATVTGLGEEGVREGRSDTSPYEAVMQGVEELFFSDF